MYLTTLLNCTVEINLLSRNCWFGSILPFFKKTQLKACFHLVMTALKVSLNRVHAGLGCWTCYISIVDSRKIIAI